MAEVRVSHLFFALVIVGAIVFIVLTCFVGAFAIGPFNTDTTASIWAWTRGYKAAQTPAEAMEKFRDAIVARDYKTAGRYTTKSYKDMLERAHPAAVELTGMMDKINEYAKDKGLLSDKTIYAFNNLDPFPRNFKIGTAPVMKADKAYGMFVWDPLPTKGPFNPQDADYAALEQKMFQKVLARPVVVGLTVEIIKEGDDWKLNIPTDTAWETEVSYFNNNYKRYHTGLDSFKGDMLNNRWDSAREFESQVMQKLKNAKQ
jgi:hypothetical protein